MKRAGFTLIELSIVLVIIGLIIGGVLVGRDLIRAAEIRATIGQKEKFDAAANAFKLKYGGLPGDLYPTTAASFGFFQLSQTCGGSCSAYRFGNGKIDYSAGNVSVFEYMTFWRHLSEANLVEGKLGSDGTNYIVAANGAPVSYATGWDKLFMPAAKLKGAYWNMNIAYALDPVQTNTIDGKAAGVYEIYSPAGPGVSPIDAYAIDSKIDDGKPYTGRVFDAQKVYENNWAATPTSGNCVYGGVDPGHGADAAYNVNPATGGNVISCYVVMNTGF